MKRNRFVIVIAIVALLSTVLVGAIAAADLPWPKPQEWDPDILGQRDLVQTQEAFRLLGTTGLLLAPISGSNLWATNLSGDITTGLHYLTKTLNLADGPSQVTWWDWRHEPEPAKDSLSGFGDGGFVLVNGENSLRML